MDKKDHYNKNYWKNADSNYLNSKKKVLKLLKILGIDTRYISYLTNTIYINNVRFSKFSKKREKTFEKYFPEIAIVRSTIFQKICSRSSKIFADKLNPKDNILLLKPQNKVDNLLKIVLEPYSRKYGIAIFESNFLSLEEAIFGLGNYILTNEKIHFNAIALSTTLNEEVNSILSDIFSGNGVKNDKIENNEIEIIYPFINVSNEWIKLFFDNYLNKNYEKDKNNSIKDNNNNILNYQNKDKIKNNNTLNNKDQDKIKKYNYQVLNNENKDKTKNNKNKSKYDNNNLFNNENDSDKIAISFMKFLDDNVPQYKENILKSAIFIKKNLNNDID
ncbi:MAG: hypothetical protein LBU74_06020 [Methanobacteriaceae archaeon]|nr:hypothetical protein [Candidatus Methanorudis spinitermitis]